MSRVANCLFGTAYGDSLGLVFEGLPAARVAKFRPAPLRQRLFGSKGALSDDTLQSVLVALAILRHPNSPELAAGDFARSLSKWFWTLPPGIGLSTAKACLRLTGGAKASGVNSAGNGAAMRSAVLGPLIPDDELRDAFAVELAKVTHTHPLGILGARIVAFAASRASEDFAKESHRFE